MRNYVIVTETTTDLPDEIAKDLDIRVIPMAFELDGKSYYNYLDERELDIHEFYETLRKGGKSVTSLINTEVFMNFFEPILNEGCDILYISFSSGLSGTYNASLLAIDELKEKYPDSKIFSVDSRCASLGEGLLVYSAALKKEEGLSIDELYEWLNDNVLKLCHWFTVDDLNHLKRGGRVSAISAAIGTALNVKPVLHVDNEGKLIPIEKVRGRKKSLIAIADRMLETCTNPEEQTIFIGHGDAVEDAEYLAQLIKERMNVKDFVINPIGPVIGSHSGPGTIALFFFGTER
ncbi:DegV family protein [Anaerocolumna aminovalerica]|uniref:DegV family protein n=1 Tax=Anaerocolumna aminovalerica TaxID=1527 RepID=UPI000BE3066C|nr:DegV family protein [Anaerocolumna aminovalerica]